MKNIILIFFVLLFSGFNYAQLVPEIEWLRIYDGAGNGNDFVNDRCLTGISTRLR